MALPDIILNPPNILVTQTASSLGIEIQSFGLIYGYVEAVYQTSDRSSVGQIILFDPDRSVKIRYGSTIYYMLDENTSSFIEQIAP